MIQDLKDWLLRALGWHTTSTSGYPADLRVGERVDVSVGDLSKHDVYRLTPPRWYLRARCIVDDVTGMTGHHIVTRRRALAMFQEAADLVRKKDAEIVEARESAASARRLAKDWSTRGNQEIRENERLWREATEALAAQGRELEIAEYRAKLYKDLCDSLTTNAIGPIRAELATAQREIEDCRRRIRGYQDTEQRVSNALLLTLEGAGALNFDQGIYRLKEQVDAARSDLSAMVTRVTELEGEAAASRNVREDCGNEILADIRRMYVFWEGRKGMPRTKQGRLNAWKDAEEVVRTVCKIQ